MLVDAHDFAESLTLGTSASRRIEREELVGWFLETHAVRLELHGKLMHLGLLQFEYTRCIHEFQHTGFVTLVERRASGIHQSVHRLLVVSHHQAVNHQKDLRIVRNGRIQRQILQFAIHLHSAESLLGIDVELLFPSPAFMHIQRTQQKETSPFGMGEHTIHHVLHRLLLHFHTADGGEGMSHACKEHSQVIIDFRRSAYRGTRVASNHLLLDGDGRWNALDSITLRLVHPPEKLSSVGR